MNPRTLGARKSLASAGLVALGLVAGGTLAATVGANAADPTPSPSSSAGSGSGTESGPAGRPQETPLTGDTLAKVKAAVLAKYPNATFERVETDSDGVYEAHITTSAGEHVTVELNRSFAVTGTEAGHGGRGGHGDHGRGGPGAGETALTGTTAAKVKAAVLAKYPGATVERVETDNDGVYEAHITTKAGQQLSVEVNKSFTVTGTESH